jgi:beta-fructofuranosidase
MGEWWHEPANSTWTEEGWAGRWGFNFEVGNFFALDEQGANSEGEVFVTLGAEWSYEPIVPQVSDNREMLWVAGRQELVDGKLTYEPTMAGRLDAGRSAYAAAGKVLPADSQASRASGAPDRFITYLWLTGDFYGTLTNEFPTLQQNWTGTLLLPRELSVGHLNVVDNELSREKGAWRVDHEHDNGTVTLATLHQKIAREPYTAFQDNATNVVTQLGGPMANKTKFSESPKSKHYMLTASITFPSRSKALRAGFTILSGPQESTNIVYQFSNESFIIDRSNSSAAAQTTDGIPTEIETGKFRLFDVMNGYGKNETQVETLDLTVVVDGGVVEVHANDRFAMSTWVRSWYEDSTDISFYVEGGGATFSDVTIYEGLVDAWPQRSEYEYR